jgi:trimeric autotransporter adhesin
MSSFLLTNETRESDPVRYPDRTQSYRGETKVTEQPYRYVIDRKTGKRTNTATNEADTHKRTTSPYYRKSIVITNKSLGAGGTVKNESLVELLDDKVFKKEGTSTVNSTRDSLKTTNNSGVEKKNEATTTGEILKAETRDGVKKITSLKDVGFKNTKTNDLKDTTNDTRSGSDTNTKTNDLNDTTKDTRSGSDTNTKTNDLKDTTKDTRSGSDTNTKTNDLKDTTKDTRSGSDTNTKTNDLKDTTKDTRSGSDTNTKTNDLKDTTKDTRSGSDTNTKTNDLKDTTKDTRSGSDTNTKTNDLNDTTKDTRSGSDTNTKTNDLTTDTYRRAGTKTNTSTRNIGVRSSTTDRTSGARLNTTLSNEDIGVQVTFRVEIQNRQPIALT